MKRRKVVRNPDGSLDPKSLPYVPEGKYQVGIGGKTLSVVVRDVPFLDHSSASNGNEGEDWGPAKRGQKEFFDLIGRVNLDLRTENRDQERTLVRDKHRELFGDQAWGVPYVIVKLRVLCELGMRQYEKEGCLEKIPTQLKQNHRAAMNEDYEGFHPKTWEALQFQIKETEMEENEMGNKAKKKAVKKTAVKKTVSKRPNYAGIGVTGIVRFLTMKKLDKVQIASVLKSINLSTTPSSILAQMHLARSGTRDIPKLGADEAAKLLKLAPAPVAKPEKAVKPAKKKATPKKKAKKKAVKK